MIIRLAAALFLVGLTSSSHGGVILSAEVYDTPGMPGYQTYDLVATSPTGYLNGFDFYDGNRGISGSLYQGDPAAGVANPLFSPVESNTADTHWLVSGDVGLSIGASQAADKLKAAYTFTKQGGQRDSARSLPFARLVTNDPTSVHLDGQFLLAERYQSDRHFLKPASLFDIDIALLDIPTGGARAYGAFEDPLGPTKAEIEADPRAEWQAGWLRERAEAAQTVDHHRLASLERHQNALNGMGPFDHEAWLAEQAQEALEQSRRRAEELLLAREQTVEQARREQGGVITLPQLPHQPTVGEGELCVFSDNEVVCGGERESHTVIELPSGYPKMISSLPIIEIERQPESWRGTLEIGTPIAWEFAIDPVYTLSAEVAMLADRDHPLSFSSEFYAVEDTMFRGFRMRGFETSVPEPGTLGLLATGLFGFASRKSSSGPHRE